MGEPLSFHGQGLNERGGTLYLATDNIIDLVALASSTDGRAWKVRLRLEEISGIKSCVQEACMASCDFLAGLKTFPPDTCVATVDGGSADGSSTDAVGEGKIGGGGGGCSCTASGVGGARVEWLVLAVALSLAVTRWRRRPRRP